MEGRNILGSKTVKCSATCFNILRKVFYSLQKKFSFSNQRLTLSQFSTGMWGAPVKTDSSTWTCQSLEHVWLSPSIEWEGGGVQAGLGVRLSLQRGMRAASLALRHEPQTRAILTAKAAS